MSQPDETLRSVRNDLDILLKPIEVGTKDYPKSLPRVAVAHQRALDRAGAGALPSPGLRGGSSHPTVEDERKEAERVKRQAEKDAFDIGIIAGRMARDARELRRITDRQAEVIHESKVPTDVLPGCRSCARKEDDNGVTIGGHFAELYMKSIGSGLCRDCWEFESAMDAIPPIRWCHLLHTQKKRAANRWLADNHPKLVATAQKRAKIRNPKRPKLCGHPTGKDGEPCARRLMHQGECLPSAEIDRLEMSVTPS